MASFQRSLGNVPNSSLVTILKQTSPFEERVTRNGIQRDIHVVIKNSPFVVQMGIARNCEIDLNHIAFDCSLLYDTEGEKGVDFVKLKPIEYKCVPNEGGDQVSVELRIKVLTSQHEDMFFKVKIQGQDPVTKQDVPNLKVITAPIKVISKPEQLKKRQPAPIPIPINNVATPSITAIPINGNISTTATPNNKKRTVNDLVVEAVTRIEKQQYEQNNILERIMQFVAMPKQEGSLNPNSSWEFLPPLSKMPRKDVDGDSFESCFAQLLKSFQAIDPNHRAEKVRRVARGLSLVENEALAEFVDMLMTEGLGIEAGREARPANIYPPQHLDVKPPLYASMTGHPHTMHPHHPTHASHAGMTNLAMSMNKSTGNGEIDSYFLASMIPNYPQGMSVNVSNGEEGYPDFLTASPPPNLPLGNSSDFLNM
eukprot:Phypoly_transcript_06284.p1 GENE.Phypoly_transcript_06284~~Phypoly_transcript_06284.p1  ORF type:complete len:425 (+),score=94.06 Phypoly_transcript_06284:179-1453(+)